MKKTYISLVIFFLCLTTGGLFFRTHIFTSLFEWRIKHLCDEIFGSSVHYTSADYNGNGTVCFSGITLFDTSDALPRPLGNADTLEVHYSFDMRTLCFRADISLNRPTICIEKPETPLALPPFYIDLLAYISDNSFISSRTSYRFSCSDGRILLTDLSRRNTVPTTFALSCLATHGPHLPTELSITFDTFDDKISESSIVLSAMKDAHGLTTKADFSSVPSSLLTTVIDFFGSSKQILFTAKAGICDGTLSLSIPEDTLPSIEGTIALSGLAGQCESSGIDVNANTLSLVFSGENLQHREHQSLSPTTLITSLLATTSCSVSCFDGISIGSQNRDILPWALTDITGTLQITPTTIFFDSTGSLIESLDVQPFIAFGNYTPATTSSPFLSADIVIGEEKNPTHRRITLCGSHTSDDQYSLSLDLDNIGPYEYAIARQFSSTGDRSDSALSLTQGRFDLTAHLICSKNIPYRLSVDNVVFHDASFSFPTHRNILSLGELTGNCSLDLSSSDPLSTLNARAALSNGSVKIITDERDIDINITESSLIIKDGIIRDSSASACALGFSTNISVDLSSPEKIASIVLQGACVNSKNIVPLSLRPLFSKVFENDDMIMMRASLSRSHKGFTSNGDIIIGDDAITFGFERNNDGIDRGWFHGNDLPLKRYVSPFIFTNGSLVLSGTGTVDGTILKDFINLQYSASHVVLENEHLRIDVDDIGKNPVTSHAIHSFSLATMTHFGTIPLHKGHYWEKHSNLTFNDIDATIHFDDKKIIVSDLKAMSNEIDLKGHITIDPSPSDYTTVNIVITDILCQLPALKPFCSHFIDVSHISPTLSGVVTAAHNDSSIFLNITEEAFSIDATISGEINEGVLAGNNYDISVEDLSSTFEYRHKTGALSFSDTTAIVLTGNNLVGLDSYNLAMSKALFSAEETFFSFDATIYNGKNEFCRLAGDASRSSEKENELVWKFDDQLCHIGGITPTITALITDASSETIRTLRAQPSFALATLAEDLQHIARTGIIPIPQHILEYYKTSRSDGILKGNIYNDEEKKSYFFDITGNTLVIGDKTVNKITMSGSKKGDTLLIKELVCDDFMISTSLRPSKERWDINFLTASNGTDVNLSFEGTYAIETTILTGQLHSLDFNIDTISAHHIPHMLKSLDPHGTLNASGDLSLHIVPNESLWHMTSSLSISFPDLHFSTTPITALDNTQLILKEVTYNFDTGTISLEDLAFSIPAQELPSLGNCIAPRCPFNNTTALASAIAALKSQGTIEGSIGFRSSSEGSSWNMSLTPGTYRLFGIDHLLSNFSSDYYNDSISIKTQYHYNDHTFWLSGNTSLTTFESGTVIFSDEEPSVQLNKGITPLTFSWYRDDNGMISLEKAEGTFSGIQMYALPAKNPLRETLVIQSKICFNAYEARWMLPSSLRRSIEKIVILDGYEFVGTWNIDKKSLSLLSSQGVLRGKNYACMGYIFERFSSHCEYHPDSISLKNIRCEDLSGSLLIPSLSLLKNNEEQWHLSMPSLTITNFRPALLYSPQKDRKIQHKNFIMPSITFSDVQGIIGNSHSFSGSGEAFFSSEKKPSMLKSLLSIPADIISHIGLDPTLLTPATGTIRYKIDDGKILFTDFKNVYSKGRASRFFLSDNNNDISYVDFDGNLHVKLKMKQHNILFKIAELFTITIKGTLATPSYTFQKQQISEAEKTTEQYEPS